MAVSFIGEGNRDTRRNHRPVANHWYTVSHNVVSSTPRHKQSSNSQTWVVIGTDWTGSCKTNYHTITTTTTMALRNKMKQNIPQWLNSSKIGQKIRRKHNHRPLIIHYTHTYLVWKMRFSKKWQSLISFMGPNKQS